MRHCRRHIKTLVAIMVLAFMTQTARGEELLMAIRLNGETVSEGEIVTLKDNAVELPIALAHQLRLRIPPALLASSPALIPLHQLAGVQTKIDPQALVVDITVTPDAFEPTVIQNYVPNRPTDTPDHPGLFMNYNILTQNTGDANLSSGLFSLGSFSDFGVAISDLVASNDQGIFRLRTALIQDSPTGDGRVTFGDSFLPDGAIGQSFPFGGIQISSRSTANTDPRQTPVETMLGSAAVPSTVDVFVNNALQSHQSVPTGPFVLENIPIATGDGNIRVVVRDALGQEQVLVKSFYTSPALLPQGQSQYSYETGMLRHSYGSASFDYAEPFASGTDRYGWTKWLTTEFHGETSLKRQVIGEQNSFLIAPLGALNIGGAVSSHEGAPGFLGVFGTDTQTHPFSAGLSSQIASPHFTQLGYQDDRTLQQSSQARIAYDCNHYGSVSASLIRLDIQGQPRSDTVALSYNVDLPMIGYFGASAFSTLGHHSTGVVASLTIPLGNRGTLSSQATHDQNGWGESSQYIQNAPDAGGFGYRALVDHNDITQRAEAGATYRGADMQVTADAGTLNTVPVARLGASGSLGFFDNEFFAARETDGNFAVVETGGVEGIHVLADQQVAGVTDSDGKLVIPHLRPHEINHITIDPADIPFDVTLPTAEKQIVPRSQTGYVVNFGLEHYHTATANLVMDNGSLVPAGTPVRNAKTGSDFVVGYDGMIYLTGLTGTDSFNVQLANGSCQFDATLPSLQALQPDLGKITCHASHSV